LLVLRDQGRLALRLRMGRVVVRVTVRGPHAESSISRDRTTTLTFARRSLSLRGSRAGAARPPRHRLGRRETSGRRTAGRRAVAQAPTLSRGGRLRREWARIGGLLMSVPPSPPPIVQRPPRPPKGVLRTSLRDGYATLDRARRPHGLGSYEGRPSVRALTPSVGSARRRIVAVAFSQPASTRS